MPHRRREFSKQVRRDAHERSLGRCECALVPQLKRPKGCGQALYTGNIFYEHILQDGAGGSPTLDNCAVLVKTCWKEKSDLIDQTAVAKTRHQHDRDIGIGRRTGAPLPGSRDSEWLQHVFPDAAGHRWERRA